MGQYIYLLKLSFLVKVFSKIVNFNIESCLKISDNLIFNEEIDFDKSFTLPSFILNFAFNSVFLITQVYIGNYIIVHHFTSLSGVFMTRMSINTCEIDIKTNPSFI